LEEAFGGGFKGLQGSGRAQQPVELMDCAPRIRHYFLEWPAAEATVTSED
jgi:hypothetical protein